MKAVHTTADGKAEYVDIDDGLFPGHKSCNIKIIYCEKGDCPTANECLMFEFRIKDGKVAELQNVKHNSKESHPVGGKAHYEPGYYYVCLCLTPEYTDAGESLTYTTDKKALKSGPPAIGDKSKCKIGKMVVHYLAEDGNTHQLTYIFCAECGCPEWEGDYEFGQPTGKRCYLWKRKLNAAENDPYTLEAQYRQVHRLSGTSDINCEFGCICVDETKEQLTSEANKHTTLNGKNGVLKYYPKGAPEF